MWSLASNPGIRVRVRGLLGTWHTQCRKHRSHRFVKGEAPHTGVWVLVGYIGTFQQITSIIQPLSQPWVRAKEEESEGAQGKVFSGRERPVKVQL